MRISVLIILLTLVVGGAVFGQGFSLESVDNLYNTDTLLINSTVTFNIRMTNNTATVYGGMTNGFRIHSPDGAEWSSTVPDTFSFGWPDLFPLGFGIFNVSGDGLGADTMGYSGSRLATGGLPAGFDEVAFKVTIGPITSDHRKTICLDSSFYPPVGLWKWAAPDYFPSWDGPHCYTVFDPNAPTESNMLQSTTSLFYTVVEDDPPPSPQNFTLTSDNAPLDFTLTESASWFSVSPVQGTTPRDVTVIINNTGLAAGTYIETVEINSPTALNTPLFVEVELEVTPKPPELSVSPDELFFNAVAGGANPSDKFLTISNLGGLPTSWSATNVESWLSLSPTSGSDDDVITVSVDISSLAFGEYDDTITISDPSAINSPLLVPVHLSVGSDLPLIAFDSVLYHVISTPDNPSVTPKPVTVLNGGAGLLNFTTAETSPWIDSIVPSGGVAPGTIEVYFNLTGTTHGTTIFDTIWVSSDDAINSPQPVEFEVHIVGLPGEILLNKDTSHLNVYECTFGIGPKPSDIFSIANIPGAEALNYSMIYDTDLFSVNVVPKPDWDEVTLTAVNSSLPVGTYYDTIMVTAEYAINSPQLLIVEYVVRASALTPEIYISDNFYIISTKEEEGPRPGHPLLIQNRYAGCMEWNIQNYPSYITPVLDTGTAPSVSMLNIDAAGYTLGIYEDTMLVYAPAAPNSPKEVYLTLKVWRFHGDWDYNGIINIPDLLLMVDYFFLTPPGPEPMPEWRVGDMNCDNEVSIEDLLYLVSYFFENGPIPCGNPY